ncbi:MAG: RagB/SusD family nutrient uptake outer membrane protein [Prevotella sp.]|nr:RagB/SusD family nutrient uptake outer membrane protein [Prevotella sp.]
MKAIKYLFASAVLAIGGMTVTGCSDLEERPQTFLNPDAYYKTEAEVDAALNGVYNRLRNIYTANSQLYLANIELYTEQGWPTYNKNSMHLLNRWYDVNNASTGNSDRGVNRVWSAAYDAINRANIVLARQEAVTMSQASHDRIIGQCKFIRAYSLWHLMRLYGGVPIVLTYTNGLGGLEVPRNTIDECYDQVTKDLEDAAAKLPARGDDAGYAVWRATKGSCLALLGEVYLYRASMNNNNKDYLTKARDYSKQVIDSRKYELMDNFTDQFYWFNANAKNNKESLFELQFAALPGQSNDMHIRFGLGRTYAYMGCYQYARMGVSGYLYREMKNNNDKRADALLSHFKLNDGTSVDFDVNTLKWVPKATNDRNAEHRCVFNCKYFDNRTDASLQKPCANFPMLRYAEVLLNYAEASNLLQGGAGLAELNMIRNRAGLASYTFTTQAAMDEEIFQQRRFEFVGEGKIFYDELRRGVLGQYAAAKCKQGTADGITYFDGEVEFKAGRNFLFKIPQSDLDSNPALTQNPDNVSE